MKQNVIISNKHYQIFFSPQVKQSVIISNKHGIYELSHELPNDLRLNPTASPRLPHGIFADGGAFVPTQEKKKKKKDLTPLHFRRRGSKMPTQEKRLRIWGN